MTESIYKEYENKYYNPNDNDKRPGDNDNWKSIQKGFHDIGEKQLETSAGLTLGKGTKDETSVTAAELAAMKSGGGLNGIVIPGSGIQMTGTVAANGDFEYEAQSNYLTAVGNVLQNLKDAGYGGAFIKPLTVGGSPDTINYIALLGVAVNNRARDSVDLRTAYTGLTSLRIGVYNRKDTEVSISGSVLLMVIPFNYVQ